MQRSRANQVLLKIYFKEVLKRKALIQKLTFTLVCRVQYERIFAKNGGKSK